MTCDYAQFTFYDKEGIRLFTTRDVIRAVWARTINKVGKAVIDVPASCVPFTTDAFALFSQEDLGMLIEVGEGPGQALLPSLDTFWFLEKFQETTGNQQESFRLTFVDAMDLLDRRLVAFRANSPPGTEPRSFLDDLAAVNLQKVFDTNLGDQATDERDISEFVESVPPPFFTPQVEKEISFRKVMKVMQQVSATSRSRGFPLYFDMIAKVDQNQNVTFTFQSFLNQRGTDKTTVIVPTTHNLFRLTEFSINYNKPNVAFVSGAGKGNSRVIVQAQNAQATSGRFSRRETFKYQTSLNPDVLRAEAEALINDSAGIYTVEGQLLGELADSFEWGDRFTISHRNLQIVVEISTIRFEMADQVMTREVKVSSVGTGQVAQISQV